MKKIILEIPEDDIEEVVHLLRFAISQEPTSNDVRTLLAPFCEEHSRIKLKDKPLELVTYSLKFSAKNINKKACYCGNPIDQSNSDCVEFSLCKDHAMEA